MGGPNEQDPPDDRVEAVADADAGEGSLDAPEDAPDDAAGEDDRHDYHGETEVLRAARKERRPARAEPNSATECEDDADQGNEMPGRGHAGPRSFVILPTGAT